MHLYAPNWLSPPSIGALVIRFDRNPGREFADLLRRTIYDLDPSLVVPQVMSLDEALPKSMREERAGYDILRVLTVIALALCMVGLFSVIACAVSCRMKEFGIRIALGATPAHLRRMVIGRGIVTVTYGVVIGLAIGLGLTRFMKSLLFETTTYEPIVYVGVTLILIFSATVAAWLPARRAASVDVGHLLQNEKAAGLGMTLPKDSPDVPLR